MAGIQKEADFNPTGQDISELVDMQGLFKAVDGFLSEPDASGDGSCCRRMIYTDEEDSNDEHEDGEVDDREYDSGTITEKAKRYQREFRKYASRIRQALEDNGYGSGRIGHENAQAQRYTHDKRKQKDPDGEVSPSERGHKFGCGCRGCSAFRERAFDVGITDLSLTDNRRTLNFGGSKTGYVKEHREKPSEYPCGGKMRGMFRQGFLKYALSGIEKKPVMMRYLAI